MVNIIESSLTFLAGVIVTTIFGMLGNWLTDIFQGEINHLNLIILLSRIHVYMKRSRKNHIHIFLFIFNIIVMISSIVGITLTLMNIWTTSNVPVLIFGKEFPLKNVFNIVLVGLILYVILLILVIVDNKIRSILIGAADCNVYDLYLSPKTWIKLRHTNYHVIAALKNGSYLSQNDDQIRKKSPFYELISPDKTVCNIYCSDNLFKSKYYINEFFLHLNILMMISDILIITISVAYYIS